MLASAVVSSFSAFPQRWTQSSLINLSIHSVAPTNLKVITFPLSKENPMSGTTLGWMVVNYKMGLYRDDLLYMSVNKHCLGVNSVERSCDYRWEPPPMKLKIRTCYAIVKHSMEQIMYPVVWIYRPFGGLWTIDLKCPTQHSHKWAYVHFGQIYLETRKKRA